DRSRSALRSGFEDWKTHWRSETMSGIRRPAIVLFAMCAVFILFSRQFLPQQPGNAEKIIERMKKDGCAALESGVKVCGADYAVDGKRVEAISFVPPGSGPFPGVLMIPGFERTARDMVPLGIRLARERFAAVAVSQPGFGKSEGPPDFVGPKTLNVLK